MAQKTSIEWTESTWNPVTGCTKISPGCKNCYAERMTRRLTAMGQLNYRNGFKLTTHNHVVDLPKNWKKPQTIFVNSMSDLFHEDVPDSFILKVFRSMGEANWHVFQVLTKRSKRLAKIAQILPWPKNIWIGVSVENEDYRFRIDHLRTIPAYIKFLSCEPLIGPIPEMNLHGIDWVIVGGESGPKSRPMDAVWVTDIRDQCQKSQTPFFFKQWGGVNKKKNGRLLDNQTWDEVPIKYLNL